MARGLSTDEKASFERDGYLILRDLLAPEEAQNLRIWAQEVHDWPNDEATPWMPYAEINTYGKQVLCRTENYADSHPGFNALLRGEKLLAVLRELAGENMILFKEKINYKLAGSGGWLPHLDSTAYTHVKKIQHLSIQMAIDPCNVNNGGLEVVRGSHTMNVPIGEDNTIEETWTAEQIWEPVDLAAGEVLIFGSYLAHRSAPNRSDSDRKALYATYNRTVEGDLREEYYRRRRIEYPPTHLRKPGQVFGIGSLRYGFGSPMLTMDLKQGLAA